MHATNKRPNMSETKLDAGSSFTQIGIKANNAAPSIIFSSPVSFIGLLIAVF